MPVINFASLTGNVAKLGALAIVAVGLFAPAIADAQGITRVNANRMSCNALKDVIHDRGAVIVRSRARFTGMRLSERYVSSRRFCFQNEITRYSEVATRETRYCSVKLCTERSSRKRRN